MMKKTVSFLKSDAFSILFATQGKAIRKSPLRQIDDSSENLLIIV